MAEPIVITVYGTPAPQGSKTKMPNGAMVESSKRVKPWREAVKSAALDVRETLPAAMLPVDGPLLCRMTFYFRRAKSHYRTGKNAGLLRESAPNYHTGTPDLSKLARATEDALTDAGIWRDDRLVTTLQARKAWAGGGHLPGAVIIITPLGEPGEAP